MDVCKNGWRREGWMDGGMVGSTVEGLVGWLVA